MSNLLKQTLEILESSGKSPSDVVWVGSEDGKYSIEWQEFERIANIEYDSGYGAQEIAEDLVVVGKDFWLERREYDGSEWWEFRENPIRRKSKGIPFTRVGVYGDFVGWKTLDELNK